MSTFYANDYSANTDCILFQHKNIFAEVLRHLNVKDIMHISSICRTFRQLSRECLTFLKREKSLATKSTLENLLYFLRYYDENGNVNCINLSILKTDIFIELSLAELLAHELPHQDTFYIIDNTPNDIALIPRFLQYCSNHITKYPECPITIIGASTGNLFYYLLRDGESAMGLVIRYLSNRWTVDINPEMKIKIRGTIDDNIPEIVKMISKVNITNFLTISGIYGSLFSLYNNDPDNFKLSAISAHIPYAHRICKLLQIVNFDYSRNHLKKIIGTYNKSIDKIRLAVTAVKIPGFLKRIEFYGNDGCTTIGEYTSLIALLETGLVIDVRVDKDHKGVLVYLADKYSNLRLKVKIKEEPCEHSSSCDSDRDIISSDSCSL